MSKVVLLEPLGDDQDTSSLARFGEITSMFGFRSNALRAPGVHHTDAFLDCVQDWFATKFDPQRDYFVVAGRATKIAFALLALRDAFRGKYSLKVLIWDGGVGQYVERTI